MLLLVGHHFHLFHTLQVVQQAYTEGGATTDGCDIGMPVEFASHSISLSNETTLKEGWKIMPCFTPVVRTLLCMSSVILYNNAGLGLHCLIALIDH